MVTFAAVYCTGITSIPQATESEEVMRQALSDADFVIDTAIARASTGASDAPPPPSDMAIVAVKVMIVSIHGPLHTIICSVRYCDVCESSSISESSACAHILLVVATLPVVHCSVSCMVADCSFITVTITIVTAHQTADYAWLLSVSSRSIT
jgi:hypothetical protein